MHNAKPPKKLQKLSINMADSIQETLRRRMKRGIIILSAGVACTGKIGAQITHHC